MIFTILFDAFATLGTLMFTMVSVRAFLRSIGG